METFITSDAPVIDAAIGLEYSAQLEQLAPNVTAIVDEQRMPDEAWYDALARLLPVLASTYQQKQLLQVQVDRARAGLPPLDASQYAPGVNVGLTQQTQQLLIWGGLGLLGIVWMLSRR